MSGNKKENNSYYKVTEEETCRKPISNNVQTTYRSSDTNSKFNNWDLVKSGTEENFEKRIKENIKEDEEFLSSDEEIDIYEFKDIEEEFKDKSVTPSMVNKMSVIRKKNWAGRVFRGVGAGSMRGSVFTLFSGAVGAGVLSLPKVVSYYGLGLGLVIIIFNAFLAYASYWAQFQAIIKSGKKKYPNLINYYLGATNARIFAWFIAGVTFISANVYVCMSWSFIQYIIDEFNIIDLPKDEDGNFSNYAPKMWLIRSVCMMGLFVIIMPLALMKNLNSLRFMSILNLVILTYVIVQGLIQTPEYIENAKKNGEYEIEYFAKAPSMDFLAGFATIILSYMCHPNFFYVRKELLNPSAPRVKKVLMYAIGIETLVYFLMGAIGYQSLGDKMMVPLFTLRPKIPNSGDYPMKIAVLQFLMLSITNVGLNLFPCREQILSIFKQERNEKMRKMVAILVLFLCVVITIVYPDIMGIFGLCGGLFCTYIGWVFPFQIMIRMMPEKKWYQGPKIWYLIGFYFIVFISVGSTVQSIFKFHF